MRRTDLTRFAAITDNHGNSEALTAVLAEIDRQGIATIVAPGDPPSGPVAAREGMIRRRGNPDRDLVARPGRTGRVTS